LFLQGYRKSFSWKAFLVLAFEGEAFDFDFDFGFGSSSSSLTRFGFFLTLIAAASSVFCTCPPKAAAPHEPGRDARL